MAASSSTSVNPNDNYYYDVFINHRGPDVKKTFASYLYRRLLSHGLSVFLDQQEFQQGENLTSQIEGAIRSASVHVAIFSVGYADSNWCLNELLLMLESKAYIIPVFYNVKPAELRWTLGKDGVYAQALKKLENKRTYDPEAQEEKMRYDYNTIENWRNALSRVAEISGFELEACNGDEGELLDKVVERVTKKVKKPDLDVAKYPTGLDEKVRDFENTVLLHQGQSGKRQIFGIVGLGGIGKTTLAKEFFNRKNSYYRGSCFLPDVRENAAKGSLNSLQRKLLESLTGSDKQINNVDEGKGILRKGLSSSSHILVILDDVDHVNQVDALLPDQTVIHSDSLILITSRSKDVLTSLRVEESSIYELTGLNSQHSLELFCLHCFSQPHPLPEFENLVYKFLKACDGLPLSLIVFGALLCGENEAFYWEDQLDRLQRILPTEIKQRLKISYDTLDIDEQHIFLDIACFFIGQNKDMAIRIWDGSRWKGRLGFRNLQNRCLVKVDSGNDIQMHDHLRDLGRDIAKASLPRRLWRPRENIDDLLLESESSVISVRGIRMVPSEYNDDNDDYDDDAFGGIGMRRLQLLDTEDAFLESILSKVELPNLLWIRWNMCPHSSLPTWIPMKNLRVLQVYGSALKTLWEGESQTPVQLRELEIRGPLSNIPKSIGKLKHLERMAISFSSSLMQVILGRTRHVNVKTLPEEFCDLQSLKVLELRDCSEMKLLPESFGNLTNLEHIDLCKCINLERLPKSFGKLIKLTHLNLKGCSNLTISSETFGNIRTLQYIDLSYCKLEVLPSQVVQQRSLDNLYLEGNIKELPSAIGELSELEVLELGSPLLDTLPPSLGDLQNLKKLSLANCKELKCLPASVVLLTRLSELRVWCCPLHELPFKKVKGDLDSPLDKYMPRLKTIFMYETEISEVSFGEGVCPNLQRLHAECCQALGKVGTLPNTLVKLELLSCHNLEMIERLPVSLEELRVSGCVKLNIIRGLAELTKLRSLHVAGCSELQEVPGIEQLESLDECYASGCVKLKRIQGLAQLTKLRVLSVDWCDEIEELEDVEHLKSLEKLDARGCPKLQWGVGVVERMQQRLKSLEI